MSPEEKPKRPRWVVVSIVLLPVWLAVSAGVAVWHSAHKDREDEAAGGVLIAQEVSTAAVADDLRKLAVLLGERHGGGEEAGRALTRTARWLEGSLGPGNVGHKVNKIRGPGDWPLIHAAQPGSNTRKPAQWVIAGYDSRPGSPGVEANATGVVAMLAACRALAGDSTAATIHYLFLPHVHDPDGPVIATAAAAVDLIRSQGEPGRVMVVESMGSGAPLWLSSRETSAIPESLAQGIAEIKGAEVVCLGEDTDLASVLFEMGLPALRVSTRPLVTPDEDDSRAADPARVAAAADLLIQWTRRCAENP